VDDALGMTATGSSRMLVLPRHDPKASAPRTDDASGTRHGASAEGAEEAVMRRLVIIVALLGVVALAIPVTAQESFDRHPHLLLQRPEIGLIEGVPHLVGYRRCVDLAGNRTVPLHAHHEHLHFGDSGVSFGGESGQVVIPAAPFPAPFADPVPWTNCEDFAEVLPLPLPWE
jgi:hypothetical protein